MGKGKLDRLEYMMNDTIEVKGIIWEDMVNYKKIGTTLMLPKCDFKCDRENGVRLCQNWELAAAPCQTIQIDSFMRIYMNNPITEAIILQGLEPLDTPISVYLVAAALYTFNCHDDLVIYTGYTREEKLSFIQSLPSIQGKLVVKWGRYRPNQEKHYDPVLGVYLISDNQYGEIING